MSFLIVETFHPEHFKHFCGSMVDLSPVGIKLGLYQLQCQLFLESQPVPKSNYHEVHYQSPVEVLHLWQIDDQPNYDDYFQTRLTDCNLIRGCF